MKRWKQITAKKKWRAERGALDAREQQERKDYIAIRVRALGRCEVQIGRVRCRRADWDTHHVIKRSQGGKFKGEDYLIRVCRPCHSLTDAPATSKTLINGQWVRGRLRISAEGGGRFRCWMETTTKRAATARRLPQSPFAVEHAPKAPEQSGAS